MKFIKYNFDNLHIFKIFIVITIFLSSCYHVNKSEIIVPDILISESQMVEILTEVQVAEAGFNISKNRNKGKKLKPEYYNRIIQEYGITMIQLRENIDYYQNYPKVMEDIYEQVLANLSRYQSDVLIELEEAENKRIADSIVMVMDSLKQIEADSLVKIIRE